MPRSALLARLPLPALLVVGACSGPAPVEPDTAGDTAPAPEPTFCETWGFGREVAWNAEGPYGSYRHDLAEDFTVPLMDGSEWTLSEHWTGCENLLFVPDSLTRSDSDSRSVWTRDLDELVATSPRNAHYFFVSVERDEAVAAVTLADMQAEVDDVLGALDPEDATWWTDRLHVVSVHAKEVGGWVEGTLLRGIGTGGFAIDRSQTIRGMGSLSDVSRYDASSSWPFGGNLAYVVHEAGYFDMESERTARLELEDATVVPLWTGEVIAEYAEMDVALPTAVEMATFDTFEIEVDMRCPDPTAPEAGNCGAWDYLAYLWVQEDDESWTELGRFITSYHRETHWVFDATPMMAHLLEGGTRHFKWEWAPSWNTQPAETRLSLRFSDQGKGYRPRSATRVATGGGFGSTYNDGREAVSVPVAADAAKVELWALVTGHGASTNQCSEFCNHQHEFTVDGTAHLAEFPEAGTEDLCVPRFVDQMVPNQWGSWWYGRGGWCPGMLVHPYQVDVTSEVSAGSDATVSYRGLYGGDTPPDGSGDIVLNAWLVVYEPAE